MSKDMSIKLNLDATDFKKELNEIEAQLDRIIEKQKRMSLGTNVSSGFSNVSSGFPNVSSGFPNGDSVAKIAEALAEKIKPVPPPIRKIKDGEIPRLGLR